MARLIWVCLVVIGAAVLPVAAQPWFAVEFLGEMEGWYLRDRREETRRFGLATVSAYPDRSLLISGEADRGKSWDLHFRSGLPIDSIRIWAADFDKNGRRDLLIVMPLMGNGRCMPANQLLFLLYDKDGLPVPWLTKSTSLEDDKIPSGDVVIVDADRDGRAEVVLSDCGYGSPLEDAERNIWLHRSALIYEAVSQTWQPQTLPEAERVWRTVRQRSGFQPNPAEPWRPLAPAEWPMPFSSYDDPPLPLLEQLRVTSFGCEAFVPERIRLGAVEDRRDELARRCGQDGYRLAFTNGRTWKQFPGVIVDTARNREIYLENAAIPAFFRVFRDSGSVRAIGDAESGGLLWASPEQHATESKSHHRQLALEILAKTTSRPLPMAPAPRAGIRLAFLDVFTTKAKYRIGLRFTLDDLGLEPPGSENLRPVERSRLLHRGPIVMRGRSIWLIDERNHSIQSLNSFGEAVETAPLMPQDPRARFVSAAAFGDFFLGQWERDGQHFLLLHDLTGVALGNEIPCPSPGTLLFASHTEGLLFVESRPDGSRTVHQLRGEIGWKGATK
jgi:hypothetical protein